MLASNLERLRGALSEISAKTKSPHALVTMLAHLDLSHIMILIDDDGTPDPVLKSGKTFNSLHYSSSPTPLTSWTLPRNLTRQNRMTTMRNGMHDI